jgi:hypothetical protein
MIPSTPFPVAATVARMEEAARASGFRIERYGEVGGVPLLALTRRVPGPAPRIYVSAGIHGDEPAPPLALLEMLEGGSFDPRVDWFVCPLLNPGGLALGTRENPDGVDLNRDYRKPCSAEVSAHVAWLRRQPALDLALALHEDWESAGFYVYEQNPLQRPSLASLMLDAAGWECPIDLDPVIDGREAQGGVIRPGGDPFQRELWPESIYLRVNHTSLAYTVEAPSSFPLERRVRALRAAVGAAVAGLTEHLY